jgi:hypothetical protein
MRVLATLERRTKEAAGPALERAGLSTDPETRATATATALLPGALGLTWDGLMADHRPVQRIGELRPAERDTADLVVAPEGGDQRLRPRRGGRS